MRLLLDQRVDIRSQRLVDPPRAARIFATKETQGPVFFLPSKNPERRRRSERERTRARPRSPPRRVSCIPSNSGRAYMESSRKQSSSSSPPSVAARLRANSISQDTLLLGGDTHSLVTRRESAATLLTHILFPRTKKVLRYKSFETHMSASHSFAQDLADDVARAELLFGAEESAQQRDRRRLRLPPFLPKARLLKAPDTLARPKRRSPPLQICALGGRESCVAGRPRQPPTIRTTGAIRVSFQTRIYGSFQVRLERI